MDFNYLRYSLRTFFDSDFKREEISDILNAKEPEKFSRAYLKSLNFKEANEARMRIKFRVLIDKAYAANIPLGEELGPYTTPEDAYLARQRYIARYTKTSETVATLNKFLIMVLLAMFSVAVVLLFSR
ncbi:hypothetical protein SAMN02910357_00242 [Succinivibrio dextrinosolvens]|uniref:hypothetical protein n=1 Tax=Succinivibrio dextrinosolvens TaxID=83771 RepID=UPI0008E2DB7B|nr:hypothetical protein [Succinivibrio dextrinosolvens]SFS34513.1 hypothetical protein SAMN02910357_00242 [Succinivibrio dextrinosolvens]